MAKNKIGVRASEGVEDATKKFLDLEGLGKYDAALKAAVDKKDADTLAASKAYADSLGSNYDPAGSAETAKQEAEEMARAYADSVKTELDGRILETHTTANDAHSFAISAQSAADKAQGEVDALETKVGEIPADAGVATVVDYVNKKTEGIASDAQLKELQGRMATAEGDITTLEGKVATAESTIATHGSDIAANKSALDVLNGTGDGSVKKQVDDAINKFATDVSNDEVVNTFKELVDYCATHSSEAAEMAGDIQKNAAAITKLETFVGKLPEGTQAADVIAYINEKVMSEQTRAEKVEAGLQGAVDALKTQVGSTPVADQIAAAKQAAIDAASADATKKDEKVLADAKSFATGEVTKVQTNVDALSGKVTTLEGQAHTHTNKAVLDGISQDKVAQWDGANAYADSLFSKFVRIDESEIDALFMQA